MASIAPFRAQGDEQVLKEIAVKKPDIKKSAENYVARNSNAYIDYAVELLGQVFKGVGFNESATLGKIVFQIKYREGAKPVFAVRLLTEQELSEQIQVSMFDYGKPIPVLDIPKFIPLYVVMRDNGGEGRSKYDLEFAEDGKKILKAVKEDSEASYTNMIDLVKADGSKRKQLADIYTYYKSKYKANYAAIMIAYNEAFFQFFDKKKPYDTALKLGEAAANGVTPAARSIIF